MLCCFICIIEAVKQSYWKQTKQTKSSRLLKIRQPPAQTFSSRRIKWYYTVLFTGCSAKKTLKSLLQGERLRITQETQIIVTCFYVLKFSKEHCFILPFYCTALCAVRSTKESFNHLPHREVLMKNEDTFQISVFSLILLNLVKNVSYFLLIALPYLQSALKHLIHWACLRKN